MAKADAGKTNDRNDLLIAGGNLVALVTVMLPAAGFLIRLFAFGTNPATSSAADTLAWSAPISQLAYTGLPSVFMALGFTAVVGLAELIHRLPGPKGSLRRRAQILLLQLVPICVFLLVAAVLVPWPEAILVASAPPTAVAVSTWARRLRKGGRRLTYRDGWMIAALIVLASSLIFGLSGTPPGITTADYQFSASSRLRDGRFVQIGDTGNVVFVSRCGAPSALIAVNRSEVLDETIVTGAPTLFSPSIVGVVFQHQTPVAGYQPPC
jgi:hypothetical protein